MNAKKIITHAALILGALAFVAPIPALAGGAGTITGTVTANPGQYLKETVVYLVKVKDPQKHATEKMDQKHMKFVPHVLITEKGDTVRFKNSDHVDHDVLTPDGAGYNLGVFSPGQSRTHVFKKAGVYSQLCSIHPEMLAYIFVGQNRYAAQVNKSGHYTIKGVPPGTYKLAIWNSHLKAAQQSVTVKAGDPATANFSLHR